MNRALNRRLAALKPTSHQSVRLERAGAEPLVLGYRTNARHDRAAYPPARERAMHEPGLAADATSRPWRPDRPLLERHYEIGPRLGLARLAFELETRLLRYPAFDALTREPEQLLRLAEYRDFLHWVVDEDLHDSRRGLGLGFERIAGRPWLRCFHLIANINARGFPDVGSVARTDPAEVDWEQPVETDIDMHWLTPVADDLAFGIRVRTRLYQCDRVDAVDVASMRRIGDAVAATLSVTPQVDLAAFEQAVRRGQVGQAERFDWPAKRYRTSFDLPFGFEEEAWAAYFDPGPWFDPRDPAGSIRAVSPERVLNERQPAVRAYLHHQRAVVDQWRSILERLGVTPAQFLADSEGLIVRGG